MLPIRLLLLAAAPLVRLAAQEPHHPGQRRPAARDTVMRRDSLMRMPRDSAMQMSRDMMRMMQLMEGPLGVPMAREGSGTL
jgi:hypothetical protein